MEYIYIILSQVHILEVGTSDPQYAINTREHHALFCLSVMKTNAFYNFGLHRIKIKVTTSQMSICSDSFKKCKSIMYLPFRIM